MYCTVGSALLPASLSSLIDVESLLNTASSSSFVAINSWKLYQIYSENLCFITYVAKRGKVNLKMYLQSFVLRAMGKVHYILTQWTQDVHYKEL